MDREQLAKLLSHNPERAIHVPCQRPAEKVDLVNRVKNQVTMPADADIVLKEVVRNVFGIDLKRENPENS